MRRPLFPILLVLSLTLPQCRRASPAANADPPAHLPGMLTLATYNLHNFFDAYDDPYSADEGTPPKKTSELADLADAFHLLNADVVVLQEIEYGGFLSVFNKSRLADLNYTAVESPTADPRGISVAVLSRLPVLRVISHRFVPLSDSDGPAQHFARDLLRVDLQLSNRQTLVIYGVHLKSKLASAKDDDSSQWRLAEARRIVDIMRSEIAIEHLQLVALCGDFNDAPESRPRTTLLTACTPPLTDPLAARTPNDRITFTSGNLRDSFDDILLSPRLADYFVPANADIPKGGPFDSASDHHPVRIKLGK